MVGEEGMAFLYFLPINLPPSPPPKKKKLKLLKIDTTMQNDYRLSGNIFMAQTFKHFNIDQ